MSAGILKSRKQGVARAGWTIALACILTSWLASPGWTQGKDFSAVEIKTYKVTDTIYMLEGAGGNIGISAGPDGVFMIDDQYAPLTDKIVAAIREISNKEIRFLINTHIHPDHVGGNENLGRQGVTIIGHESIRKWLAQGVFGNPPAPDIAMPVITFNDSVTFHLNGEEARAYKVPNSHTDGDTIVHFMGSDVIHTGDVFRTNAFPVIDTRHGGTYRGTIETLDIIYAAAGPSTRIIPGHGEITDRAMIATFRDMVATIGNRVQKLVDAGATLEAVIAARVTADYDERWDYRPGFFITKDDFVATIYKELSGS